MSTASIDAEALRERALAGDTEAQFALGRLLAGRQEWGRARRLLRDAANKDHAGALTELALFALFGIGTSVDYKEALALLERAEAAGSGEASYQLAIMGWSGVLVPFDPERIGKRLRDAARRDFAPALRALALVYAHHGVDAEADACLARAAVLGDNVAAYLLGLKLADDALVAHAASRGLVRAQGRAPAGTAASLEAATRIATPSLPAVAMHSRPARRKPLHADPLLEVFEGAYSAQDCEYVIAMGANSVQPSLTIDDHDARLMRSDYRTSSDFQFVTFEEDFGLRWLQWRMLEPLGVPMANAEPLVLLRYQPGEEYKPHRDYLPPSTPGNTQHPDQPGQRVHTVFTYLVDVEEGGETDFPTIGQRVPPIRGNAVHFVNVFPNGEPDPRTLHAGLAVKRGEKWLATLWTRQRRFRDY
ncbi:MAG TPA: 2OG-Fe(II) oxygenase [Xanthomonadales bacterium]|nr:2OG-Fe(II) oxygenase [Xanthomonadales bacterium]